MTLVRVSRWLVKLALALAMADRDCSAVGVDVGGNILVGSHLVTLGITPHQPWQCASFWSHRKGPSWQGQGVDSSVGLDGTDLADLALGDLVKGFDLLVSNALGVIHEHPDGTTGVDTTVLDVLSSMGFHEHLDAVDLGSGVCLVLAWLALLEPCGRSHPPFSLPASPTASSAPFLHPPPCIQLSLTS